MLWGGASGAPHRHGVTLPFPVNPSRPDFMTSFKAEANVSPPPRRFISRNLLHARSTRLPVGPFLSAPTGAISTSPTCRPASLSPPSAHDAFLEAYATCLATRPPSWHMVHGELLKCRPRPAIHPCTASRRQIVCTERKRWVPLDQSGVRIFAMAVWFHVQHCICDTRLE